MGDIGRICREAASAKEIDRPILAYRALLKQQQEKEGHNQRLTIPFLEDESWKKLCSLDLCTSHCGRIYITLIIIYISSPFRNCLLYI